MERLKMIGWETYGNVERIPRGWRLRVPSGVLIRRGIMVSDYVVEATLVKREEPERGWAGIWVRQRDKPWDYGVIVNMYENDIGIVQYANHEMISRKRIRAPNLFPVGKPVKLTVEVKGLNIRASANGVVIEDTLDPMLSTGDVGLHSWRVTTDFFNVKFPASIYDYALPVAGAAVGAGIGAVAGHFLKPLGPVTSEVILALVGGLGGGAIGYLIAKP